MPTLQRFKDHNTNGYIMADATGLFQRGRPVSNWLNMLTKRVSAEIAKAAPSNKRPRWAHYGPPLKMTIRGSTYPRKASGKRYYLYTSVGSTAPYAMYVDQGSGIHAGKSSWEAKILPPWPAKGYELYEKKRDGRKVMIEGQEGKFFFAKGLEKGFDRMVRRSFQPVGVREGVSGLRQTFLSMPQSAVSQLAATPTSPAFQMSLNKWRLWKSEAREKYREDQARDAAFRAAGVPTREALKARQDRELADLLDRGRKIRAGRKNKALSAENRDKVAQDAKDLKKAKDAATAKDRADLAKRRDDFEDAKADALRSGQDFLLSLLQSGGAVYAGSEVKVGFNTASNKSIVRIRYRTKDGTLKGNSIEFWTGRKP